MNPFLRECFTFHHFDIIQFWFKSGNIKLASYPFLVSITVNGISLGFKLVQIKHVGLSSEKEALRSSLINFSEK